VKSLFPLRTHCKLKRNIAQNPTKTIGSHYLLEQADICLTCEELKETHSACNLLTTNMTLVALQFQMGSAAHINISDPSIPDGFCCLCQEATMLLCLNYNEFVPGDISSEASETYESSIYSSSVAVNVLSNDPRMYIYTYIYVLHHCTNEVRSVLERATEGARGYC